MNIDIGAILSRAFQAVIKNRVLWAVGFFAALLGSGSNTYYRFDSQGRFRLFDVDVMPTPELIALIVALVTVVAIAFFVLKAAFEAGLIAAGDKSARMEPPTFGEAWQAGKAKMWLVLGLSLIFVGFIILLVLAVTLMAGITVALAIGAGLLTAQANTQMPDAWAVLAGVGWGLLGVFLLMVVAVPLAVILAVVTQIAQRAVVLDNQTVGQAWSTGWRLMRANLGSIIWLLLAQIVVNLVVGAAVLAVLAPVVLIPVVALTGGTVQGASVALWVTVFVLLILLLRGVALALPTAWNSMLWTLFYRAATVGLPEYVGRPAPYGGQLPPTVPGGYSR